MPMRAPCLLVNLGAIYLCPGDVSLHNLILPLPLVLDIPISRKLSKSISLIASNY